MMDLDFFVKKEKKKTVDLSRRKKKKKILGKEKHLPPKMHLLCSSINKHK